MADYTIVNLKEVEDAAPTFGLSPNVEARFARSPLGLETAGISYQRLAPSFRQPFGHRHREQEEIYVVIAGSARARLGDEIVELRRWDTLRVPGETWRGFEGGPEGVELIVFGAAETGEHSDAEMSGPDWWPQT